MTKEELRDLIDSDLYRLEGKVGLKLKFKNVILSPGFKFIFTHRKCNYYSNKNRVLYYFYRWLLYRYNIKYGFEISNMTQIDNGFYIGHRGSIVINPNVKIGKNFSVTSGVTIGQENRGSRKGVPIIGDRVWIGANATLVGNIKVGNNVLIAPGAFINFDIPDNSVVIGNPGVIKKANDATKGYITWLVQEEER